MSDSDTVDSFDYFVEPLGKQHDRGAFYCGVEPLDRYFKQQALQDARKRVAALSKVDSRLRPTYKQRAFTLLCVGITG